MSWNPDCPEDPCRCPGTPLPPGHTRPLLHPHTSPFDRVEALAAKADSTNDPILGDEIRALATDESWTLTGALERAWEEGFEAGARNAEGRGPAHPENPYQAEPSHPGHNPVQHRDRKRPWCNTCGRAADGELIGTPRG